MQDKVKALINKYEEKLKVLEKEGHDDCLDCCDYTALGENEACIHQFLKELKNLS